MEENFILSRREQLLLGPFQVRVVMDGSPGAALDSKSCFEPIQVPSCIEYSALIGLTASFAVTVGINLEICLNLPWSSC